MGRGLSDLQRSILKIALEQDGWIAANDVLEKFYQCPPNKNYGERKYGLYYHLCCFDSNSYESKPGNPLDFNYDLKKIWNSMKVKRIRALIKENKCDGCWTPCKAYQTILGNLI